MRPQSVIDAETRYYLQTNACGGRVKYPWGVAVDRDVGEARAALLRLVGKSPKDYAVSFTLNTTTAINLVLHQLPVADFGSIVTSDIEHNSVFLPSITWAKNAGKKRTVLARAEDGSLPFQESDLDGAVVLVNSTSNIDGRSLRNVRELADAVHRRSGLLLLDGAQTFGHDSELLRTVEFDAAFGSAHKMYGPSLGFVIIRKDLLRRLSISLLGGGTVQDVRHDDFDLISSDDELHARLEIGLQNWGGILGLKAAVEFMELQQKNGGTERERALGEQLFSGLKTMPRVQLFNKEASSVLSFSVDGLDAHRLALYLGEQGIMCRSGTFCCHFYLLRVKHSPPLLRASLGLHNTPHDIDHFLHVLQQILSVL